MGNRNHRSTRSAFMVILAAAILFAGNAAFAAVNSRLVFISNQHNTPVPGRGTLVLDMEAISNDGAPDIYIYRNAFQLAPVFLGLGPAITFSDQYFTFNPGPPPRHVYLVSENYDPATGVVSMIYTFWSVFPGNTPKPVGTDYQKIARVTIEYDMATGFGSVSWSPGYNVTGVNSSNITGALEPIPPELNDISLPVELTSFTAVLQGNKALLTWVTQSEINNQGFEVYRSGEENGAYIMIASYQNTPSLQGGGNSNTARTYTYEDVLPAGGQTFWYQIADVDYQGVRTFHGPIAAEMPEPVAEAYVLYANYPNPFNPETTIRFEIPPGAAATKASLVVYNSLGMEVRVLASGSIEPGSHAVQWDGTNERGELLASGIYFYRLQSGAFSQTRKMMLVR